MHGDIQAAHTQLAQHIVVGECLLPERDESIPTNRTPGMMTVVPVTAQLSWHPWQQEAAAKPSTLQVQFPLVVATAGLLVVCDARGAQPLVCLRLEGKLRAQELPQGCLNLSFCHQCCTQGTLLVFQWCTAVLLTWHM